MEKASRGKRAPAMNHRRHSSADQCSVVARWLAVCAGVSPSPTLRISPGLIALAQMPHAVRRHVAAHPGDFPFSCFP